MKYPIRANVHPLPLFVVQRQSCVNRNPSQRKLCCPLSHLSFLSSPHEIGSSFSPFNSLFSARNRIVWQRCIPRPVLAVSMPGRMSASPLMPMTGKVLGNRWKLGALVGRERRMRRRVRSDRHGRSRRIGRRSRTVRRKNSASSRGCSSPDESRQEQAHQKRGRGHAHVRQSDLQGELPLHQIRITWMASTGPRRYV